MPKISPSLRRSTIPSLLVGYVGISLYPSTAYAGAEFDPTAAKHKDDLGWQANDPAHTVESAEVVVPIIPPTTTPPEWSIDVPLVPPVEDDETIPAVTVVPTVAEPEILAVENAPIESVSRDFPALAEIEGVAIDNPDVGENPEENPETTSIVVEQAVESRQEPESAIAPPTPSATPDAIATSTPSATPDAIAPPTPDATLDAIATSPSLSTTSTATSIATTEINPQVAAPEVTEDSLPAFGRAPSPASSAVSSAPTPAQSLIIDDVEVPDSGRVVQPCGNPCQVEIASPEVIIQTGIDSTPLQLERDTLERPLRLPPAIIEIPEEDEPDLGDDLPMDTELDSTPDETGNFRDNLTLEQRRELQRAIILNALSVGNDRYPAIIDPTDNNFTFESSLYRPLNDESYGRLDFRLNQDDPVLDQLTYGYFPKDDQFYWILPENRVVLETEGWVAGIQYQGRTDVTEISQRIEQEISLWGLQAVWNLPQPLQRPNGLDSIGVSLQDLQQSSIQVLTGQVTSDSGTPGEVILNSGIDLNDPNVIDLDAVLASSPGLSETSTNSSSGGRSLFEGLEDNRTPVILQAFPTNDLSPLLSNDTRLRRGEPISDETLAAAGISFGNPLTGEPGGVALPTTSIPGIKLARVDEFDNLDLLNVLVNPDLEGIERDRSYLNSLFWTGFVRPPESEIISQETSATDWYQVYISRPHNRAMIEYDPDEISATYTDIFANPGASLTFTFEGDTDGGQTLNSALGLAIGGVFEAVNLNNVQESIDEARAEYAAGNGFSALETTATPEQRRSINQRLNRTLRTANFNSGIEQTSGRVTLDSEITPDSSHVVQLRTGIHQRRAQVADLEQELTEGETFFSEIDISNDDFGPLTYTSIPVTEERLPGADQEAFATEIVLTTPDGRQLVKRFSSAELTSAPLGVRSADLAFDRIEITRVSQLDSRLDAYRGQLNVPAVELAYTGSSGIANYSVNTGVWVNLDEDEAPGVDDNPLGFDEPGIGAYVNGFANAIATDIQVSDDQELISATSYGPTIRAGVDTTGDFNVVVSYDYTQQRRDHGWSVRPGVAYVNEDDDDEFIAFLSGQLGLQSGWSFRSNLELQDEFFVDFEALKRLSDQFMLGGYVRNYTVESTGLQDREPGFNAGVTMRYTFLESSSFLETRIGGGEDGFDLEVQGGFRF